MAENRELIKAEPQMAIVPAEGSLFFDVNLFEHALRVGDMLSKSNMVPEHFSNNTANCVIALNMANRMKCDPFMLMQNMYIVHGKPGIEAKLAIALVNASGKFTPIQYEFNKDKTECVAHANRTGTGEECRSVPVNIQMAKDEGWVSKVGSKWKTMPILMLQYRAAMFFARAYCPEALLGMQSREELQDTYDMTPGPGGYTIASPQSDQDAAQALEAKLNKGSADIGAFAVSVEGDQMAASEVVASQERSQDEQKKPDTIAATTAEPPKWDPAKEPVAKRYSAEKRAIIMSMLDEKGVEFNPAWPGPQLHAMLLSAAAQQKTIDRNENEAEASAQQNQEAQAEREDPPPPEGPSNEKTPTYFHDIGQLSAMPKTLQRIYDEIAEAAQCLSEEVSPKSVNVTLKRRFPAQWDSARVKLGFSFIAQTDEAADRWNNDIIALVDDGMKI